MARKEVDNMRCVITVLKSYLQDQPQAQHGINANFIF